MQILAIRGRNLASLAESFEIDFTAEPLLGCGLFAITGETGAGKSTILDAMCLALYGECPRLSGGGAQEDVPDASGEAIKARDARAILRQGAASGMAEVDFRGSDGNTYRSRWSVRRARERMDGRLQNVDRGLWRLDGGNPVLLENQTRQVDSRIEELMRLSYEEFRRTVLLAQGDFDAFLLANSNDRAALLEKVTGTRIYRMISRKIYDRHEVEKARLERLALQRGEQRILTKEERVDLDSESAGISGALHDDDEKLRLLNADLQAHLRLKEARQLLADAARTEEEARSAFAAAEPQRERLAHIERALPLKPDRDAAQEARKESIEAETKDEEAERLLDDARQKEETAQTEARAAREAFDAADRACTSLEPAWTQADQLDARIADAEDNLTRETAALADVQDRKAAALTRKSRAEKQVSEEEERLSQARDAMGKHPALAGLAAAWETVDARIGDRIGLTAEMSASFRSEQDHRKKIEDMRVRLADLDQIEQREQGEIDRIDADLTHTRGRIREIEEIDPQAQMNRIVAADIALRDMRRAGNEIETALMDARNAREAIETVEAHRNSAASEAQSSREMMRASLTAIEALSEPVARAEAAASETAQNLRLHLVDGEPCPVCGALDHPVHAEDALAAMARDLRERLDTLRKEADRLSRLSAQKDGEAQGAVSAIERLRKDLERALEKETLSREGWSAAYARAFEAGAGDLLPEDPVGAQDAIAAAIGNLSDRKAKMETLIAELAALRKTAEGQDQAIKALIRNRESRARDRAALTGEIAIHDQKAALSAQAAASAKERIHAIDIEIAPALSRARLETSALDADASGIRAKIEKVVLWWRDKERVEKDAREALDQLAPERRDAEIAFANAISEETGALTRKTEIKARAAKLREERAGLLGGEKTDLHRARFSQRRSDAVAMRDKRAKAHADAVNLLAVAQERRSTMASRLAESRRKAAVRAEILEERLRQAGMDAAQIDALIADGPGEADRIRQSLKAIDETRAQAAGNLAQRKADLERLMAAGYEDKDEDTLKTEIGTISSAQDTRRERIGAIGAALRADDAARERLEGIIREIDLAQASCDTWAAVNEAVGSRSGDRFVRIAQSVTLGMLVEHANHHLADLKPRYRLVRGGDDLSIHVLDADMGEDPRATRSLSGGERFLVSLALALALSHIGGQGGIAATLFIDEGFGSLDAESLDIALDALEALQAQGRMIGVISHVEAMKERIPVQINVRKRAGGASAVSVGMASAA